MQKQISSRVRVVSLFLSMAALPALVALVATPPAYAQEAASVSGTVTDASGAAVPNASVTLTYASTNVTRKVTSNGQGVYSFANLQPGAVQITAAAPGFTTFKTSLVIAVGGLITLNAPLGTGSASVTVEVSASDAAQLNTATAEVSQVITPEQVSQLPSLTRNIYDFIAITGNVSAGDNTASGYAQNGANRGVNFSLNGQRNSGTEILLDGVENLQIFGDQPAITVPVDDVLEYRVITNNFAPEYGRASGGVVSVATKSGTNALHGTVWEFNRISATTSNTVDNAQAGVPKGIYTRNMFGAAVGGPVIKDKLFFFASTEFLRVRSSANQIVSIPTAQLLAASAANVRSFYNTYAGTVVGSSIGTTSNLAAGGGATPLFPSLDPGLPVFNNVAYASPNDAGGGLPQNRYNVTGRLDYSLGDKTQTFFRYVNYNEQDTPGGVVSTPYSQYNVGGANVAQAYLLSVAHEFSSSFSTIGKLSFTRVNISNAYNTALQNVPTLNLAPNATNPANNKAFVLPGFYDSNPGNGGLPFGGPQNTIQYNQDLAYTVSRHQIQGGVQLLYIQENQGFGAYAQASEQLGKSQTQGFANLLTGNLYKFSVAVNPRGATPCTAAQVTASAQPGGTVPASCAIQLPAAAPAFARSYRFHDSAGYLQDQFKATPRLTLDYGVRYEYYGVQHNNNQNLDSNFYYGTGANVFAQVRNGNVLTVPNSPTKSFWNPQYGTVSPRIGFALDLFGNGLTSLRAGYGISYERNFGNVTFNAIQNPPNYAVIATQYTAATPVTVTNSNLGPVAAASGVVALPPTSLRHIDQNIRTAQTQFWSASLAQKVARNSIVEVTYNGSRGIHLYDIKNYNIPGEGNLYLGDPISAGLTYPNAHFTNDNNRGSNGDSYYHAVNASFTTQDIHHSGLSINANYTFAHATDDLSTTFSETAAGNFELGYTNATNPALDHGSSDFDIRQRFVLAPIYRTPSFFKARGGALAQLFGGYQITGIYTVRTGTPFSLYDSTNNNSGYQVPRYNTAEPLPHTHLTSAPGQNGGGANTFILASLPVNVPFGNAALGGISDLGPYPATMTARNKFYGPGAYNLDVSFSKSFPIYERVNLELRAEGFDVTNHHNLYVVQSLDDAANYAGTPFLVTGRRGGSGANPASDERRFLQFAGKINF